MRKRCEHTLVLERKERIECFNPWKLLIREDSSWFILCIGDRCLWSVIAQFRLIKAPFGGVTSERGAQKALLHPGTPLLQLLLLMLNPGSPTFILQNAPYFSKMIRLTKEIETYFIWWYLVKLKLTGDRLCLERHFREKSNQWRKF